MHTSVGLVALIWSVLVPVESDSDGLNQVLTKHDDLVPARDGLSGRAAVWTTDAFTVDDITVPAWARPLALTTT